MGKDLEERTKQFALDVISFTPSFPRIREADVLARQLLRVATSIGANYCEANRAVLRADFANKIDTVQKEAAETKYWLAPFVESAIAKNATTKRLQIEASELLAIFTTIGRKLKKLMSSTLGFLLSPFRRCAV
jgi:four helix bundle protein